MLDLVPAEVADVNETLDTVLEFCEHTEVGDVADNGLMCASDRLLAADVLPGVGGELLDAERHLAGITVDGENLSLYLVADLEELLSIVETGAPGHLGHVYETLDTGLNRDECAVVGQENDLTLDRVTDLEVRIEVVPRMRSELLETESDSLLLLVEVENDNFDLLLDGHHIFGMIDAAP